MLDTGISKRVSIEGIHVTGFSEPQGLFQRLVQEVRRPEQAVAFYLNVHVANTAFQQPDLKAILRHADLVYCDGAGIQLASRWLGNALPTRLTAADWFLQMLAAFSEANCSVFLLGGEPGVPEAALNTIARAVPQHTVIGTHHGYLVNDPSLEDRVIQEINALNPDILIVGFGTPLQEVWIDRNRHRLNARLIYAMGAVMDYFAGKVPRCPAWMGNLGLEWLFRFCIEPKRLFARYIIGNPWFLSRIAWTLFTERLGLQKSR